MRPQLLELYISQIADGEKDALAELYEQTRTAVYGFSLSILKNAQDAEDVLQTTYIRIYEAAGGYHPSGKPMAWILTIARNLSLMKFREYKKTVDAPPEEWEVSYKTGSDLSVEDKMTLEAAIRLLTDEERQIVMLHGISGFKHREISEFLKIPLPTVLSKYHRAIKRLNQYFEEEN